MCLWEDGFVYSTSIPIYYFPISEQWASDSKVFFMPEQNKYTKNCRWSCLDVHEQPRVSIIMHVLKGEPPNSSLQDGETNVMPRLNVAAKMPVKQIIMS